MGCISCKNKKTAQDSTKPTPNTLSRKPENQPQNGATAGDVNYETPKPSGKTVGGVNYETPKPSGETAGGVNYETAKPSGATAGGVNNQTSKLIGITTKVSDNIELT